MATQTAPATAPATNGHKPALATTDVPSIFVALPTYDGRVEFETAARWCLGLTGGRCRVGQYAHRGSLLALGFNTLWCQALEMAARGEVSRFAMIHADVIPERSPWVDRLEQVLQDYDADVASVVIPIKTGEGLTSTAIGDPADPWRPVKRLTVREALRLPRTFDAAECGFPGHPLLVNTGLWMARLDRGDWQRKVHFEIRDRIVETPDGLRAQTLPEDWNWSHQMWKLGVKVVATRAVAVQHVGRIAYANNALWGQCETDPMWDQARDPMVFPEPCSQPDGAED